MLYARSSVWWVQPDPNAPYIEIRKDSTFSEADYGFRAFGELLRNLEEQGLIELSEGPAKGDPVVQFNQDGGGENEAFSLLVDVVTELQRRNGKPALSGLKNQVRKRDTSFSERKYGFAGFLQFCKAAATRGLIELEWDEADKTSLHAVAYNRFGMPLATGRLLEHVPGVAKIGRMAARRSMRGGGAGRAVLEALMRAARERGYHEAVLHAQTSAASFYARSGFIERGPRFEEVGIPHVEMVKTL